MQRSDGRKHHARFGAVFLGGFLVLHLGAQASVLGGADAYDSVVGAIARWPYTWLVESVLLGVPLAYHVIYGFVLLRRPTPDVEIERYGDKRIWVLQRMSALLVLAFLVVHLWETRVQRLAFGVHVDALFTLVAAHLSWTAGGIPWLAVLYLLGLAATLFHLTNGLLAAARATPALRRPLIALALLLYAVGTLAVLGFATGTRLLSGPDADTAPCGSAVPDPPRPPLPAPTKSP